MKSLKNKIEALDQIKIKKVISAAVKKEMREIIWHGITEEVMHIITCRVEILDKLINERVFTR